MTYEALLSLLQSRRSVRRFRPEAPGREVLTRLIEAAITAPSASNKQPWRFFVVENPGLIARLAQDVRAAVDRIARHIEPAHEAAFRTYGDYFTRFAAAPVVIVALHRPLAVLSNLVSPDLPEDDGARIRALEHGSGLVGTSMALSNLLLAAHAMGLGASGLTGPLVAEDRFRALLEIPESWSIAAVVAVGYADEEPTPTSRKPAAAVTRWIE